MQKRLGLGLALTSLAGCGTPSTTVCEVARSYEQPPLAPVGPNPSAGDLDGGAIAARFGPLESDSEIRAVAVALDAADGCEVPGVVPLAVWTGADAPEGPPGPYADHPIDTATIEPISEGRALYRFPMETPLRGLAGESVYVSLRWPSGPTCGLSALPGPDGGGRAWRWRAGSWEDMSANRALLFEAQLCE